MSEEELKNPKEGAQGARLDESDQPPAAKKAKKAAKKKAAKTKTAKAKASVEELEARIEQLEAERQQRAPSGICHMTGRPGAPIQRGNTGQWFTAETLQFFKEGCDPMPEGGDVEAYLAACREGRKYVV